MENKVNEPFTLKIGLEMAYEIISYSTLVILIGLAFIFASNLLTFNWYSCLFGSVAFVFWYLKYHTYLFIADGRLTVFYFKFIQKASIDMKTIDAFIFYAQGRKVEICSKDRIILTIHINEKKKKQLLNWLIQNYPSIPCLFEKGNN